MSHNSTALSGRRQSKRGLAIRAKAAVFGVGPSFCTADSSVIDHALTRPWTADKKYTRNPNPRPNWPEYICAEQNAQVVIGGENYFPSADRLLIPAKKNQAPPDLRYFSGTHQ